MGGIGSNSHSQSSELEKSVLSRSRACCHAEWLPANKHSVAFDTWASKTKKPGGVLSPYGAAIIIKLSLHISMIMGSLLL